MTPQWQKMRNAPRDGQRVLGWFGNDEIESVYFEDEQWRYVHDGDVVLRQLFAWMPLPAPPEVSR